MTCTFSGLRLAFEEQRSAGGPNRQTASVAATGTFWDVGLLTFDVSSTGRALSVCFGAWLLAQSALQSHS